jgi:hypothetical protein
MRGQPLDLTGEGEQPRCGRKRGLTREAIAWYRVHV